MLYQSATLDTKSQVFFASLSFCKNKSFHFGKCVAKTFSDAFEDTVSGNTFFNQQYWSAYNNCAFNIPKCSLTKSACLAIEQNDLLFCSANLYAHYIRIPHESNVLFMESLVFLLFFCFLYKKVLHF